MRVGELDDEEGGELANGLRFEVVEGFEDLRDAAGREALQHVVDRNFLETEDAAVSEEGGRSLRDESDESLLVVGHVCLENDSESLVKGSDRSVGGGAGGTGQVEGGLDDIWARPGGGGEFGAGAGRGAVSGGVGSECAAQVMRHFI